MNTNKHFNPLHKLIVHGYLEHSNINLKKLDKIYFYLKNRNISSTMCKFLGRGMYGEVFQINKDTALKITHDRTELNTSTIIKDHPYEKLVKIKEVFKCKFSHGMEYFIIQELLKKPSLDWKIFADDALPICQDKYITPHYIQYAKKHSVVNNKKSITNIDDKWQWLENIASYFKEQKIKFADLHSGNIMKRGEHHVLIDFGVAKAPKQYINTL